MVRNLGQVGVSTTVAAIPSRGHHASARHAVTLQLSEKTTTRRQWIDQYISTPSETGAALLTSRFTLSQTFSNMNTSSRSETQVSANDLGTILTVTRLLTLVHLLLLIPEFCPGGQGLTCGPTISTNQRRPWD